MDRTTLHKIFEKAYSHEDWIEILQSVFGAKQLYTQPKPILLPSNDRATEAYEIGSFTTSDDRIIGLYRINIKPDVWLDRNKVSLRELLRNIYKYDVDGAIVVFVQEDKWRLSFISEIKVLNDEGEIIKQATEPKRYTYLLGEGEKVKTPADRLSKLTGKATSIQDILNAFSVEALNEEFYKIVQSFFYDLVGGKISKGVKVTEYGEGILQLPIIDRNIRQEFAVRLIGRTVFCWFLKMKKSDDNIALLPESLLSSEAVKGYKNYYHTILERLFFQTLNTPMAERISNLPPGAEIIPFLNGGLFEPNIEDYYEADSKGNNQNDFCINDDWFLNFFEELEKYNFTIDENSVTEIEVSVDPEMLGRIFENLLAEIDPDSGETARKATGSFYTPREIVDYMATESLIQYIHNKTTIKSEKIRPVFKTIENDKLELSVNEIELILVALDQVKILDPACGSGAFPMGILQKIVQALQKLDPKAQWWKKRQIGRIKNPTVRKLLREKLSASGVEYARKIGVIQNSLYGVDIQPVAAEISKLRCFLSLIVDENIDETKPNRGIEPLPNLEFKFVTADTLINLPEDIQHDLYDNFKELQQLEDLRNEYIQSSGKNKAKVKKQFLKVQKKIAKDQSNLFADINSKAYKLGNWNPFNNDKVDWFDPKWMFGVEKFDVVIGNPPYIKEYTNSDAFKGIKGKDYYQGKMDIWYYFACHLFDFLTDEGNLTFIATNNWVTNVGASKLRDKIVKDCQIVQLIDFGNTKVFSSADIQTMILIAEKKSSHACYEFEFKSIKSDNANLKDAINMLAGFPSEKFTIAKPIFDRKLLESKSLIFNTSEIDKLLMKIKGKQNFELDVKNEIAQGIVAPQDFLNKKNRNILNGEFIEGQGIFNLTTDELNALSLNENEKLLIKPFYSTFELKRIYGDKKNKLWIIYTDSSFKDEAKILQYPNLKKHLDQFRDIITSDNRPYGLHRARNEKFFQGEKIISLRKCSDRPTFTYTDFDTYVSQTYFVIKTNRINQKYLTALLNSKLIEFWLRYKGKMQGFNFQVDKGPLVELPLITTNFESTFAYLIDYILIQKKYLLDTTFFERVIDAMFYEIYLPECIKAGDAEILKYVSDLPQLDKNDDKENLRIVEKIQKELSNPQFPISSVFIKLLTIEEINIIEGRK